MTGKPSMSFVIVVALVAGLVLGGVYVFQERLVFFPSRAMAADPSALGLPFEDFTVETADGESVHGWLVPAQGPERAVVLFHHGNAGNISHRLETLALLHRLGLTTCIFDYRGYGLSSGRPTEPGVYQDSRAVWDMLTARGVEPGRVVIWGRSLGSAVAARLARDLAGEGLRPAGLILESAFASIPDMGREAYPFLPVRLIARMEMRTVDYVRDVNCPVLVAHSPSDEIVPHAQGRTVFEAAPEPKRFLEMRGGHNDGFLATGRDYLDGVDGFLATVLAP